MWQRLRNLWDSVQSSYWFVPGLVLAGLVIAAEGLLALDRVLLREGKGVPDWVPKLRAEVAEQMLLAVANASVALASLVFSITLIVLTLTAGNYGPRLLRRFMSDTPTQVVLGLYTGTLVYCLLVLRATASTGEERFIPHLAVSGGMVLAFLDVMVLTFFVHHVSRSIHATDMLWNVVGGLDAAIEEMFPEELGLDEEEVGAEDKQWQPTEPGERVEPSRAGYVRAVDPEALMRVARERQVVVRIRRIGTFVGPRPAAEVFPGDRLDEESRRALREAVVVGRSRTPVQDVEYSLDRLVEMAGRALSPGVNDPFTALACLDQIERAMSRLAVRKFPSAERYDDDGELRVVSEPVTFEGLLKRTLDPIRQYGCGQVLVMMKMLEVLGVIREHARAKSRRAAVERMGARVWESCRGAHGKDPALGDLEGVYRRMVGGEGA